MTFKMLFTSSIGKKFTMGLTGLFLISFLVIHCTVNSMIFFNDGGEMFNTWAHFMSHNYIVRFLEIGLFAGLIVHIVQGLLLWKQNNAARPVKYAMNAAGTNSKWYSRSMGLPRAGSRRATSACSGTSRRRRRACCAGRGSPPPTPCRQGPLRRSCDQIKIGQFSWFLIVD